VPWFPALTISQGALPSAVHPHVEGAVTAIVPVPASLPVDALEGTMLYVQVMAAADCCIETCWFAIVSVPVRDAGSVLAATANATTPLPAPLAPLVMESQPASARAFQVQPAPAVTLAEPVPPPEPNEAGETVTLYAQGWGDGPVDSLPQVAAAQANVRTSRSR
jgi:hypothetical protein